MIFAADIFKGVTDHIPKTVLEMIAAKTVGFNGDIFDHSDSGGTGLAGGCACSKRLMAVRLLAMETAASVD